MSTTEVTAATASNNNGSASFKKSSSRWGILSGGTMFDAFIMEASQQIGQSILTLPWIFANMGFTLGILCLLFVTCSSMIAQHSLISLYVEYKKETNEALPNSNSNSSDDGIETPATTKQHIASYHDVITWAAGPKWGRVSQVMVIAALSGLSIAQIISTASNLYLLNVGLDKRALTYISGLVMSLVCFVPTYREYRAFTFLGLVATTYTAWYMVTASIIKGPVDDVEYTGPTSLKMFFTCLSSMIFMFGTHSASIEKADVMNKPSKYDVAYVFAMLYVYTITIPNGIAGYHTFGSVAAATSNAFALYEDTIYRQVGIVLMCLHEVVAFGLFAGPLFHMLEKSLNIQHKGYWICTSVRFVIVAIMLFFAVAFPFFGVINGLLGAFTTTFCTYVIPTIVYNKYYNTADKYSNKTKKTWLGVNFTTMKIINWIIIVMFIIFGFGFGGWGSLSAVVDNAESISNGFFAKCYKC